jgi:hypothetical protein
VTFGGVGQGVEGQHDVWRGAPYAGFNAIRIRSVTPKGPGITIEADLAAAYPKVAALSSFTRTFTFDGTSSFTISDRFTLKEPTRIEWRLQSDTPFAPAASGVYSNAAPGEPGIDMVIAEPKGLEVTRAIGRIKAPGQPGSITAGPEEDRGHVLTGVTKAPAGESRIDATITIRR